MSSTYSHTLFPIPTYLFSMIMMISFTQDLDKPKVVSQIIDVALDYSRLLLQLRQAKWQSGSKQESSGTGVLEDENNDMKSDKSLVLEALSEQSHFMNMFLEDSWLPATLEFFLQVSVGGCTDSSSLLD